MAADRRRRGDGERRGSEKFLTQVRKACAIGRKLRDLGIRKYGVIRIDTASSPGDWAGDPEGNTRRIADTFRQACDIADGYGERLAAEGEICWGGMHSWKRMVQLLEMVNRPKTLGYQADMAHNLLFTMGYNAPEDRLLPDGYDWKDRAQLDDAYRRVARALRPWTIDFHVAQNDAHGEGVWLSRQDRTSLSARTTRTASSTSSATRASGCVMTRDMPMRAVEHICWDGCMFSNDTMMKPQTWDDVLKLMIDVRNAHGWNAPVAVSV